MRRAAFVFLALPLAAAQAPNPNTCKTGFVWREAFDGDVVCVTPEVRANTREDNARAAERRSPTGGPYGPNTCKQGVVWRNARQGDLVCVTPETRDQVAQDNAAAAGRRIGNLQPAVRIEDRSPLVVQRPQPVGPPVKILGDIQLLRENAGYKFHFITDVNASARVEVLTRAPVRRGNQYTVEPGSVLSRGGYNDDRTTRHYVQIPYNGMVRGRRYYYLVTVGAAGRAGFQYSTSFEAILPVRID